METINHISSYHNHESIAEPRQVSDVKVQVGQPGVEVFGVAAFDLLVLVHVRVHGTAQQRHLEEGRKEEKTHTAKSTTKAPQKHRKSTTKAPQKTTVHQKESTAAHKRIFTTKNKKINRKPENRK